MINENTQIKMSLIETYDPLFQFKEIRYFDLKSGDVINWKYEFNLSGYHKLKVEIPPSFAAYDRIRDTTDWGIRLQTEDLDLAFLFFDRTGKDYGVQEIELVSASYKLTQTPLVYYNEYYSGAMGTFLSNIGGGEFEFVLISGDDPNIKIQTGALTNYEAMEEAISYKEFFRFLEVGLYPTGNKLKTRILYGDFREIESRYNLEPHIYPQLKPRTADNLNQVSNDDLTQAIIEDYEIVENHPKFSHVLAYLNSAINNSPNNIIQLDPNADYVDPRYPIETINGVNYVRAFNTPIYPIRIKVYPVLDSATTEDQEGNEEVTLDISAEIAYRRTVSYIQSQKPSKYYKFNFGLRKLTLPGVPIRINFKDSIKSYDGNIIETINVDETVIPTNYQGDGGEIIF